LPSRYPVATGKAAILPAIAPNARNDGDTMDGIRWTA
jgi:hypothetical protein